MPLFIYMRISSFLSYSCHKHPREIFNKIWSCTSVFQTFLNKALFSCIEKKVFSIIETTHFSWHKKLINIAFENSLCKKTAFKFIDLNKINYMKISVANWRDFSLDLGGKLVSGVFFFYWNKTTLTKIRLLVCYK